MLPADERRAAWQPVRCARCGAAVQVAKFSPQHTSVQWTAASAACCAEFAAFAANGVRADTAAGVRADTAVGTGAGGGPVEACGALRDSIDAAVASGLLAVRPPSYE